MTFDEWWDSQRRQLEMMDLRKYEMLRLEAVSRRAWDASENNTNELWNDPVLKMKRGSVNESRGG